MNLVISVLAATDVSPPSGGLSPLAWFLIVVLAGALATSCGVGLGWARKIYDDLKECNAARAAQEEDILGLLRVLRTQMEQSRGGRPR